MLLRGNEREIAAEPRASPRSSASTTWYKCNTRRIRADICPLIDVGFLLSESIEAVSFAARELMAMGKPLISSNYAGLVENVDDRLNGRLSKCGDADGVAEAILGSSGSMRPALAEVSRNARLKAERVFSVENQVASCAASTLTSWACRPAACRRAGCRRAAPGSAGLRSSRSRRAWAARPRCAITRPPTVS